MGINELCIRENFMENKITIIGCGDIGVRLAAKYGKENQHINGVVKSQASLHKCHENQIDGQIFDLDKQSSEALELEGHDLYYFAPPPKHGQQDSRLLSFLERLHTKPRKILLISTTGVYGDCEAEWIDETHTPSPNTDRAKRRLNAEQTLKAWCERHQVSWVILRVPGIYALDRLPLQRIKKGIPMVRAIEAGWTNRIHADDLANVAKKAMENSSANGQIYNACDGKPSVMTDYFDRVADYAKLPRPPKITLSEAEDLLSPGILSYLKESRKISNEKMLRELHITLEYPNLEFCLARK